MKKCSRCKSEKNLEEFSRRTGSKDGRSHYCKDCDAARSGRVRKQLPPIEVADVQLAYLGGLLDGEGYIGLTRKTRKSGCYKGNHLVHARMVIGITAIEIESIQREYGLGKVYRSKARKAWHKDRLDWTFRASEMKQLLPKLLPYLKIKKRQAELLIEYFGLPRTKDDEYRKSVHRIHSQLKHFNHRRTEKEYASEIG